MMNVELRRADTRFNAILGCPYVLVQMGIASLYLFLLASGIVCRTLLGA